MAGARKPRRMDDVECHAVLPQLLPRLNALHITPNPLSHASLKQVSLAMEQMLRVTHL